MAYSPKDLNTEVLAIIAALAHRGEVVNRSWLVTKVLLDHPIKRPRNKDPDEFSNVCRKLAASRAVDAVLVRLKYQDEGGDPDQAELELPRLPGYKHLRRVYPLKRESGIMLVPLHLMTDAELDAKVNTYRKAARGLSEHADELERYAAVRRTPKVA